MGDQMSESMKTSFRTERREVLSRTSGGMGDQREMQP